VRRKVPLGPLCGVRPDARDGHVEALRRQGHRGGHGNEFVADFDMSEGRLVGDKKYSPVASPRPDSRGRYLRRYISKF